jgi:Protein of unknown function (DUF2924)
MKMPTASRSASESEFSATAAKPVMNMILMSGSCSAIRASAVRMIDLGWRLITSATGARSPGTVPVREWERKSQRVMVMADGFAWNGQNYDSLSKVAFAITGTKWNGPRFFGLRDKEDGLAIEARS